MNKRKFLKTGILGAIVGLFAPKVLSDSPKFLKGGEFVISKDIVNKLGRVDKEFSISAKEFAEKIEQLVMKTMTKESKANGILSHKFIKRS
jgi:hypothetical protein